jgi:hypothetical protein
MKQNEKAAISMKDCDSSFGTKELNNQASQNKKENRLNMENSITIAGLFQLNTPSARICDECCLPVRLYGSYPATPRTLCMSCGNKIMEVAE